MEQFQVAGEIFPRTETPQTIPREVEMKKCGRQIARKFTEADIMQFQDL
jgi:hypothetical protein